MKFAQSTMLVWLWIVIPLGIVLLWNIKRKDRLMERFADFKLLPELMLHFDKKGRKFRVILMLLFAAFSLIALARPQWGFEWQEIKRQGMDIFVAIDTSKSMLTQDIQPNRLERSKLAIKDLVQKLAGDRVGLIAFAGDAFLVCPLTVDYNGFLLSLDDIDEATVPRGGTNIAEAIEEAVKGYSQIPSKYKAVIIITDGENLEGEPLLMAKKAADKGIKLYTVGIGTKEGELIQIMNAEGQKEFLKDQDGNFVKSRLNENLLEEIALAAGGIYVRASGAQMGLDLIYERELSKFERREVESKLEKRYYERFQIPLGIAFIFIFFETCLSLRRKISAV